MCKLEVKRRERKKVLPSATLVGKTRNVGGGMAFAGLPFGRNKISDTICQTPCLCEDWLLTGVGVYLAFETKVHF